MGEYLNTVFNLEVHKSHCIVMKSSAGDLTSSSSAGNTSLDHFA